MVLPKKRASNRCGLFPGSSLIFPQTQLDHLAENIVHCRLSDHTQRIKVTNRLIKESVNCNTFFSPIIGCALICVFKMDCKCKSLFIQKEEQCIAASELHSIPPFPLSHCWSSSQKYYRACLPLRDFCYPTLPSSLETR